jgi:Leucine-rich repeat (LRR) protein
MLKKLFLNKNRLEDIPDEIAKLPHLKLLNLDDNDIKKLPFKLGGRFRVLKELSVEGNPMISPPVFVCRKGVQAIMKYLNG